MLAAMSPHTSTLLGQWAGLAVALGLVMAAIALAIISKSYARWVFAGASVFATASVVIRIIQMTGRT